MRSQGLDRGWGIWGLDAVICIYSAGGGKSLEVRGVL